MSLVIMCKKEVMLAMAALSFCSLVNAYEDFDGASVVQLGLHIPIKFTGGGDAFEDLLVKKSGVADAKTVKDIFAKDEFNNKGVEGLDSGGFKWGIGADILYTYYFVDLFGIGLKLTPLYWITNNKFVAKGTDGGNNSGNGGNGGNGGNSNDNKDLTFKVSGFSLGIYLTPVLNFLEDGLKFDDGEQAGGRLELQIPFGADLNFFDIAIEGKEDAKKVWSDDKKLNKDCLKMFRLGCNPTINYILPFGLYFGVGAQMSFLGEYKVETPKGENGSSGGNNGQNGNETKSADVKGSFDAGVLVSLGYDLGGVLN